MTFTGMNSFSSDIIFSNFECLTPNIIPFWILQPINSINATGYDPTHRSIHLWPKVRSWRRRMPQSRRCWSNRPPITSRVQKASRFVWATLGWNWTPQGSQTRWFCEPNIIIHQLTCQISIYQSVECTLSIHIYSSKSMTDPWDESDIFIPTVHGWLIFMGSITR